jgi:hypothetical protein
MLIHSESMHWPGTRLFTYMYNPDTDKMNICVEIWNISHGEFEETPALPCNNRPGKFTATT